MVRNASQVATTYALAWWSEAVPPPVSLTPPYQAVLEGVRAVATLTRPADPDSLDVRLRLETWAAPLLRLAVRGVDYELTFEGGAEVGGGPDGLILFRFNPGSSVARVLFNTFADGLLEGPEAIQIVLEDGPGYVVAEHVAAVRVDEPPVPEPAAGRPATVGRVWHDRNGNGMQDADEPGLQGVEVRLNKYAGDTPVYQESGYTDANGFFAFGDLEVGPRYDAQVVNTTGMRFTRPHRGPNVAADSDASPVGMLPIFWFNSHDDRVAPPHGAGLTAATGGGSIGGRLWRDDDRDGMIDPAEPGQAGLVQLYEVRYGGEWFSVGNTYAYNGEYHFGGLTAGIYFVKFQPMGGPPMTFSRRNPAGADTGVFWADPYDVWGPGAAGSGPLVELVGPLRHVVVNAGVYVG